MPRSSPSCHQVRRGSPSPPLPRPPVAAPHPSAEAQPQHLPSPHPGSTASGQRHSLGSRNSPGPGQRLTHWRTLMKPSGSSSRRQRSPTSRRSTCGDTAGRGSGRWGAPGRRWFPCPTHTGSGGGIRVQPTSRWRGARRDYLLARRLVRRAAGALGRGHAGAVDAGCGVGAPWPGGGGHCGEAGSCGLRAGQPSGAGARAAVGGPGYRLAGWVAGALLFAFSEAAAAAMPRRQQKAPESDSNFCQTRSELGRRITWRALPNPPPAPSAPLLSSPDTLKGPAASVVSSAAGWGGAPSPRRSPRDRSPPIHRGRRKR
ncbi:hypothetical protein P7K49_016386 [Saguinus oedipus]|uniref:Uncharacterized protein n=1 Tax=Saguinus oedipus TaxID=9490 RepID=A0ABQ9VCD6_SAGOE|nr:hypothetical protein P7K49_016386 [Saguinus oedipus]